MMSIAAKFRHEMRTITKQSFPLDNVVVDTLRVWAQHCSSRPTTLVFYRDELSNAIRCDVMATNICRPSDLSPLASTEVSR